ncbi:MAG: 4Fe-4S binding protein [Clostridia bacterium]|nr:4Fe-4S binding protein [Clostridia bacterium]
MANKDNKNTAKTGVFATLWRWTKRMFMGASKELVEDKFAVEQIESPSTMAVKAFFRRKLAVVALVVLVSLFLFVFIGPLVVPMDLIKKSLKNATFIGGMDSCLCREANDCKDFPHDVGCLFLGEAGRVIVKHNLGKEIDYEEACRRVDKAAEYGLMGQAVWVEVEQLLWGIRNDQMDKFLEICFCCPCCCIAMRLARNATEKERHRFHPSGWTAVADRTRCVGCKQCVSGANGCPVEAISFGEDGKVRINQELCVGCGICKSKCKPGVISIKQTMPMREDLHEYFLKDYNLDLKIWEESKEDGRNG